MERRARQALDDLDDSVAPTLLPHLLAHAPRGLREGRLPKKTAERARDHGPLQAPLVEHARDAQIAQPRGVVDA